MELDSLLKYFFYFASLRFEIDDIQLVGEIIYKFISERVVHECKQSFTYKTC